MKSSLFGLRNNMLPFAPGITGYYVEEGDKLSLELRSLRNPKTKTFIIEDKTVINTIKSEFSPILEDYLGDNVPGFSNVFFEMIEYPLPIDGKEREFEITKGVQMKFCWIPAGKAMLGSPESEAKRWSNEIEHEFENIGFWMGKYTVTQSQWKMVMGNNPSVFQEKNLPAKNLPVERVSWNDCQDFIKKCSVSGLKLQLPHEDQWEYACRGGKGNKQAFYWGNTLNGDEANCNGNYLYGTDKQGHWLGRTSEVGSYEKVAPHPWNLCDMHGNVWEWCNNLYIKEEELHIAVRGGGWGNDSEDCRSSYRGNFVLWHRGYSLGFRLIIC